jgi:uncharacterized protein involved in exopolysaccharide biosynthesis
LQAWATFKQEVQILWEERRIALFRKVLIIVILAGLYAYFSPDEYRVNAVIYPEETNQQPTGLNSLLGSLPGENKNTGTIRAILASQSLRNACIRDSITLHGQSKEVREWLREDQVKKGFILGRLMPPPEAGEGSYTFANRYLSRILLIFTDEDGFISLRITTADDSLSLMLGTLLIEHAQQYHRDRQIQKAVAQSQYLQMRADSISRELEFIQKNIARYGDQKRYTARYSEEVELQDLYRQQELLQQLFVSVNLLKEESVSRNHQSAPLFQILDPPQRPLDVIHYSVWLYCLGGFFFGGIFFFTWTIRIPLTRLVLSLL